MHLSASALAPVAFLASDGHCAHTLHCVNCFHSQDQNTVLSQLNSQDPRNLGMLAGVVVCSCCSRCRPVFLLTQVSDVAETGHYFVDTGQWCGWRCGRHMSLLWPMQASTFTGTGQWYGQCRAVFLLTQASDVAGVVADICHCYSWSRSVF